MVVAGCDVGDEGAEDVEWGAFADLGFEFHVVPDLVEGDVAGAFDHDLAALVPGALREFADGAEFGDLCGIGGVGYAAGAEAVADGEADIVLAHDVADVVEDFVHGVLFAVVEHPFGQQCTAFADDAADSAGGEFDVFAERAGVDGEEVDSLAGLLFDDVENGVIVDVFDVAIDDDFVDGDGAEHDGAFGEEAAPDFVEVRAGAEVHDGIGAEVDGQFHLGDFLVEGGADVGGADVGVDFDGDGAADGGGDEVVGEMDAVCRNDEAAGGEFTPDHFGIEVFALRDASDGVADEAGTGDFELCRHFMLPEGSGGKACFAACMRRRQASGPRKRRPCVYVQAPHTIL